MWFEALTGFEEISPNQVRQNLRVEGNHLVSNHDGRSWHMGELEVASLEELRLKCPPIDPYRGTIKVSEVVADVKELHADRANEKALFQAASQFNLLEMVSPHVTPEEGIDGYAYDITQGPSCAISCGAGTIYRNYFVPIDDQIGQTAHRQIDCLGDIGHILKNDQLKLWRMSNGYALPSHHGLQHINDLIGAYSDPQRDYLISHLNVGIQWDTEVTIAPDKHRVSQIYCSALPVAYGGIRSHHWAPFARLILEATYEATLYAALINWEYFGNNRVYLTMVGGGVFGNESEWILQSMQKAIDRFKNVALDVRIVSYRKPNADLKEMIT
jgi:hypothetical protein